MSLKWRSSSFPKYGQATDLVPPQVSVAKQELYSARSPGMKREEAGVGVEAGEWGGEADVCCVLIKAVFLLLICCHGNANKYLILLALRPF